MIQRMDTNAVEHVCSYEDMYYIHGYSIIIEYYVIIFSRPSVLPTTICILQFKYSMPYSYILSCHIKFSSTCNKFKRHVHRGDIFSMINWSSYHLRRSELLYWLWREPKSAYNLHNLAFETLPQGNHWSLIHKRIWEEKFMVSL